MSLCHRLLQPRRLPFRLVKDSYIGTVFSCDKWQPETGSGGTQGLLQSRTTWVFCCFCVGLAILSFGVGITYPTHRTGSKQSDNPSSPSLERIAHGFAKVPSKQLVAQRLPDDLFVSQRWPMFSLGLGLVRRYCLIPSPVSKRFSTGCQEFGDSSLQKLDCQIYS